MLPFGVLNFNIENQRDGNTFVAIFLTAMLKNPPMTIIFKIQKKISNFKL
jgi:hypothetical protein